MTSLKLGNQTVETLPLVLGGNPFGWTSDREESFEVLDAFLAAGGSIVDTADVYSAWAHDGVGGQSEQILGEWMSARNNRADVVVATKMGSLEPYNNLKHDSIMGAVDASLERLQTDYIDLYYAHHDDETTPIPEQVESFDALVKAGKVREVALSNYTPERMREYFEYAQENGLALPVAIQNQYNLLHRKEFEQQYQPLATEFGAATFPYFALASGMLTGKYRKLADLEGKTRQPMASGYATDDGFAVVDELVRVAQSLGA